MINYLNLEPLAGVSELYYLQRWPMKITVILMIRVCWVNDDMSKDVGRGPKQSKNNTLFVTGKCICGILLL